MPAGRLTALGATIASHVEPLTTRVSALDAKIDDLYKLPPAEFTVARNALAKTLTKDEARLVKALEKPTVAPWAVNQVYWRARSTYDRLMKIGEKLRTAQIAALEGRSADVRAASDAHRRAISEAVAEAERLAAAAGVKPGADALARTFEALSLATTTAGTPGRLLEALQPAGFEALMGVTPAEGKSQKLEVRSTKAEVRSTKPELVKAGGERRTPNAEPRTKTAERRTKNDERLAAAAAAAAEREAAREAAEKKRHEAAVKTAEADLARVQAAEQKARDAWEKSHDDLLAARQALTDLRRTRFRSS